jgi:hypothetical protein
VAHPGMTMVDVAGAKLTTRDIALGRQQFYKK